jgi:DNA-binding beta-propeller fold protein YncE
MINVFRPAVRIVAAVSLVLGFVSPALPAESTPSPALLITDTANSALVIADPKDQHIVASIPVGKGSHEIAVSPDGKLAMVSGFLGSNTLTLIDLKEQKEISRYQFSFPTRANSLVWVDGKFYFTAEDADSIGRYDPATKTVDAMIGLGQLTSHVILYNPADKSLIVTSRNSNSVTFVESVDIEYRGNKRANWKVTPVPSGITFNEAMDLSPDGKELWTAEFRGGKVSVVDVAARKSKETFEVPELHSDRLKFTPDGKRVLLSDLETGELRVLDAATHKEIKRVKLGKGLEAISIAPDSSTAYVAGPGDNAVFIVDLKTFTVTGQVSVKSPISVLWIP